MKEEVKHNIYPMTPEESHKIPKEFFGEKETELIGNAKLASTKCKCIRYVGSTKWYPNGCKIHPNG